MKEHFVQMKGSNQFQEFSKQLLEALALVGHSFSIYFNEVSLTGESQESRLAFWINTYINIYILNVIFLLFEDTIYWPYILASNLLIQWVTKNMLNLQSKVLYFHLKYQSDSKYQIGQYTYSLWEIEYKILKPSSKIPDAYGTFVCELT